MSRKVKSVSFNLNDPWESKMYDFAMKHSNFSTFVKRLIQNSLPTNTEKLDVVKVDTPKITQSNSNINHELMRQLI